MYSFTAIKVKVNDNRIPRSFQEALEQKARADAFNWEFNALIKRNTFKYVPASETSGTPVPIRGIFV